MFKTMNIHFKSALIFCSRRQFKILPFFKNTELGMIFHENRLLADDSNEISYLIFSKIGKMSQNLSSAVVVIGALRANIILKYVCTYT